MTVTEWWPPLWTALDNMIPWMIAIWFVGVLMAQIAEWFDD